mmetsp:Transcript_21844/g.65656  ORF Transcript_21844/g.65656 Transcript_21844/m.65656 type:complete len:284 (+) Transcript_21844:1028-1879(+)
MLREAADDAGARLEGRAWQQHPECHGGPIQPEPPRDHRIQSVDGGLGRGPKGLHHGGSRQALAQGPRLDLGRLPHQRDEHVQGLQRDGLLRLLGNRRAALGPVHGDVQEGADRGKLQGALLRVEQRRSALGDRGQGLVLQLRDLCVRALETHERIPHRHELVHGRARTVGREGKDRCHKLALRQDEFLSSCLGITPAIQLRCLPQHLERPRVDVGVEHGKVCLVGPDDRGDELGLVLRTLQAELQLLLRAPQAHKLPCLVDVPAVPVALEVDEKVLRVPDGLA